MKLFSTKAFIIYTKKLNDADMLLGYVTENYGKITCFANNARKSRKRFLGKLEPAMLTTIKFYNKPGMTIDILYEADIIEDYSNVRKNIDTYLFLTKITEVSRILCQERDDNKDIFYLIKALYSGLNKIDSKSFAPDYSMSAELCKYEIYFISNLLNYEGIFPNFVTCTICSESNSYNNFSFSLKRGGVVCKSCIDSENRFEIKKIPVNFINLSKLMIESDLSIINKLVVKAELLRECSVFLTDFLEFHTGRRLKSFKKF